MAAMKTRMSSFSRNTSVAPAPQAPGLKSGPNGTIFLSSGIPDLDKILGGGFPLGSLVMVMEDTEAPHHMLLLRNFMSQGLVHNQPLLYASPSKDPRAFLGTLPSPVLSKDDRSHNRDPEQLQEKGLRIAWQYKKYFGEHQPNFDSHRDNKKRMGRGSQSRAGTYRLAREIPSEVVCPLSALGAVRAFSLKMIPSMSTAMTLTCESPWRHFLTAQNICCLSIQDPPNLAAFRDCCAKFLAQFSRNNSSISCAGRVAIQSFCAPQCEYSNMEWDMLSFIRSLKGMIRDSNAVAVITFPPSLLSPSSSKRWQHIADTLLSVKAIPDEDKELANLLTGYQDMVGLLNVHKVANVNTQVT
ncbi:hypothetical protein AAG906_024344 [Vitis piasezkii]